MLKERKKLLFTASFSLLFFLCITPSFLYAPDHEPQAAQNLGAQGGAQHASQAQAQNPEQRDLQENLPAGISFYLIQHNTPVLGADRRVLKFVYLGPGLVQEND